MQAKGRRMNVRCSSNVPAELRMPSRFWWIRCGLVCWLSVAMLAASLQRAQAQATNETGGEETTKRRKVFSFEGGNPFDLIMALDRHFRTRLVQILTLPETL